MTAARRIAPAGRGDRTVRHAVAFAAGTAAAIVLVLVVDTVSGPDSAAADPPLTYYYNRPNPDPVIKSLVIDPRDDVHKAGEVHGALGWRFFDVPAGTSRASDNQMRFVFTAPAEILQVDISVDINDPRVTLVEFAALSTRGTVTSCHAPRAGLRTRPGRSASVNLDTSTRLFRSPREWRSQRATSWESWPG